ADTLPIPVTALPRAYSAPPIPDGPGPVGPRLSQEVEPWPQASYWNAQHQRALQREALLRAENEQLRAQLRLREQQLFGRKTEASAAPSPAPPTPGHPPPPRRPRGQQRGRPGPRRRDHSHLPAVLEEREIPGDP